MELKDPEKQAFSCPVIGESDHSVILWSPDGVIQGWSAEASKLYGYEESEAVGRPAEMLFPEDERGLVSDVMSQLKTGKPLQNIVMKRSAKSGEVFFVLASFTIHHDKNCPGFAAMERKLSAHQAPVKIGGMPADEQTFMSMMKAVNAYAIFMVDPQGRIASWNKGAERIKGFEEHEVLGKDISLFYSPEDANSGKPYQEFRLAELNGSSETEGWRIRKDGKKFWAHVITTALKGKDGSLKGFSKIVCDLTEKKSIEAALAKSEQHFRTLVENSLDLITLTDKKGSIFFQSNSIEKTLGYTPADVIGQSVFDYVHPGDLPAVLGAFSKLAEAQASCETMEVRVRHKHGLWRVLEVRGSNLLANPELHGIMINAVDITERKHLEKEVLRFNEHEQVRLGYDLHDGLTQHLVGVEFMIRVLEQKLSAKDLPEAADAKRIADHISRAIVQTRDLARELYPMGLGQDSFPESVTALASDVQRHFGTKVDVVCGAPIHIQNEELALNAYQIVREAVKNAIKTGHSSRISIELKSSRETVSISVRDDGKAVEAERRQDEAGLRNIINRAKMMKAALEIHANASGGITITCTFLNKSSDNKGV